ncbi:unnamed protein product, partial [Nesidiocoris tenuis]
MDFHLGLVSERISPEKRLKPAAGLLSIIVHLSESRPTPAESIVDSTGVIYHWNFDL